MNTKNKTYPLLFDKIQNYCEELEQDFESIPEERKIELRSLSAYLSEKFQQRKIPELIVICTHNSRRSHLGQIWLAIGAQYFGLPEIKTYSGGTEATAFHPNAVEAVRRVGLHIQTNKPNQTNPSYQITWNNEMKPYVAYSTRFDEKPNPTKDFVAIMVCSEADQGCPFVPGCDFRLSLPFHDPKAFDNTALQDTKYDERCKQIGAEMLYVMSKVETK